MNISDRVTGYFPIAIATSISFEFLLGILTEANKEDNKNKINNYNEIWINVRTIFRNLVGSLSIKDYSLINSTELSDVLKVELETIYEIIRDYSYGRINVYFYLSEYIGMDNKYGFDVIRRDITEKQKQYTKLLADSCNKLLAKSFEHQIKINIFKAKLQPLSETQNTKSVLILTHYPYDLISEKLFKKLSLLESHTGAIKTKEQWYTKYLNCKDYHFLPFNLLLLQVFGDKETFLPKSSVVKKEVLDLAKKYKWHSLTTLEKVKFDIGYLKNHYLKDTLLSLKLN